MIFFLAMGLCKLLKFTKTHHNKRLGECCEIIRTAGDGKSYFFVFFPRSWFGQRGEGSRGGRRRVGLSERLKENNNKIKPRGEVERLQRKKY